jgi:hypothetical protein
VHNKWLKIHGREYAGYPRDMDQSYDVDLPPEMDRGMRINVGVDVWDFIPVGFGEILDIAKIYGTLRT